MDDCNPDCHRTERDRAVVELAIIDVRTECVVRLVLDGDDLHIRLILDALRPPSRAA